MQPKQQKQPKTARQAAVTALLRMERDGAYSNLLVGKVCKSAQLSPREEAFARALFYGVLERKITLDVMLTPFCGKPLGKLDAPVGACLRLGLYQLVFLEGVESFAAVNETVELVKWLGFGRASGFVNGVLRSVLRQGADIPKPAESPESLSAAYSCPLWLVKIWLEAYGREAAERVLAHSLGTPPLYLRVNTLKTDAKTLLARLEAEGVSACEVEHMPNCLLAKAANVEGLSAFAEGLFHVQDMASQLCVSMLSPQPHERILDLCSAPGGKSFTAAQYMNNTGELISGDLHEKRVRLVTNGAARLGISMLHGKTMDAGVLDSSLGKFHRVLCDVPCSGFGTIRRKPEIKYKSKDEIKNLPVLQEKILSTGANYVMAGGVLVYSTCTLLPAENQQVTARFLASHPDFALAEETTLTGQNGIDSDGFYAAKMVKKREGEA